MMTALLDRKLAEYRAQLERLAAMRARELAKPAPQHNLRVLWFVYRETYAYNFALAELSALRDGDSSRPV